MSTLKLSQSSCSPLLKRKDAAPPTPTWLLSATALDHTAFSPSGPMTLWWTCWWANSTCWLGRKLSAFFFSFTKCIPSFSVTQSNPSLETICSLPWDLMTWDVQEVERLMNTFELFWKLCFKSCSADLWNGPSAIWRADLAILASTQINHKGIKISYNSAQQSVRGVSQFFLDSIFFL